MVQIQMETLGFELRMSRNEIERSYPAAMHQAGGYLRFIEDSKFWKYLLSKEEFCVCFHPQAKHFLEVQGAEKPIPIPQTKFIYSEEQGSLECKDLTLMGCISEIQEFY